MDITSVLIYANLVAGLLTLVAALVSAFSAFKAERDASQAARPAKFEQAILSDDIFQLGNYLEDVLGKIQVGDYAGRNDVKFRVDSYLDRIANFLEKDIIGPELLAPHQLSPDLNRSTSVETVKILQEVNKDLENGQLWNALAKLRRAIEMFLISFAERRGIKMGKRIGAGYLLQQLRRADAIDPGTGEQLRTAIDIANRAIHGEEVSTDDALRALNSTVVAFSQLS